MPRADYWGVKQELRQILAEGLTDISVWVEQDMQIAAEMTPWVCVYLEGREIPDGQPIAAGRVMRVRVRLSIWIWCYALELESAEKERDRLLGEIELILANNRTLNDKVDALWIEGGELPSTKDQASPGFFSGGEIKIASDMRAEV